MKIKKMERWWGKYKCSKCGNEILADKKPIICVEPMPFRTSGICGGAYVRVDKFNRII